MSIKAIEIRNYRLCKEARLELSGNLTALLGKNGSGKTTILHAIELLNSTTDLAPSMPYYSDIDRKKYDVANLSVEIEWKKKNYTFELEAFFLKDTITAKPKETRYRLVDTETKKSYPYQDMNYFVEYSSVKWHNNSLKELLDKKSKSNLRNDVHIYKDMIEILEYIREIKYIATSDYLDSAHNNTTIEVDSRHGLGQGRHGSQNTKFLMSLYELKKKSDIQFRKYEKIVSRIGGGLIDKIDFESKELPKSRVQLYKNGKLTTVEETKELIVPIFTIGENKLYNHQLSEGTFRALALVYYVLNSGANIVILEEPELSVHYELLADLIGIIKGASKSSQVIISTHSERIINLLDYKNIVIIRRNNEGVKATSLVKMLTAEDKDVLSEYLGDGGGLSGYISTDL